MCLHYVSKREFTEKEQTGIFYKIFKICSDGTIEGRYRGCYSRIGVWNKASGHRIKNDLGISYTCGFHGYVKKKDALQQKPPNYSSYYESNYIVLKCKYKNPTALGDQNGFDCIVAQEMLILPNQKELKERRRIKRNAKR